MDLQADKIKIERKKKGMTIKDLARKIGYTDAYISQIETGKVIPSIKVLKKIVDTLDLSFREIIVSQNQKEKLFFKKNEHFELRNSNNEFQEKLLCTHISSKKMQPIYKIINPNAEYKIYYQSKCEKFGFVVLGTIQIKIGNKVAILNEQDSFYVICFNDEITIKNIDNKNAEILCIDAPPNI